MAFTSTGTDMGLVRNPLNGKFDFDWEKVGPNKGNPKFDDTRSHAVLSTMVSHKRDQVTRQGGYYWDDSNTRGTYLYKVKQDRLSTGGQLQGYAEDGGQQLISLQMISTFSVSPQKIRPGSWALSITWSVPAGKYTQLLSI